MNLGGQKMLIGEILARNARMYGNEVALIEREPAKDRRLKITWKEFDDQANRFANGLIARGIKKGDKVMLVGFGVGLSWGATIITI